MNELSIPIGAETPGRRRRVLKLLARPLIHVLIGLAILVLDLVTEPYLLFPILFVVPVTLCAWFNGRTSAYTLAVLLPIGRLCIAVFAETVIPPPYAVVNALIRIAVLVFLAYFVSRSARQTRKLERELALLESFLPVCASCKAIRDRAGNWQPLEVYVTEHSESVVSHGICPECAKKLYPEVWDQINKR